MEILVFLAAICCFALIAWTLGFFNPSTPKQKNRPKSKAFQQAPFDTPEEAQKRVTTTSKPTRLVSNTQFGRPVVPKQTLSTRRFQSRLSANKHRQNIRRSNFVLCKLRNNADKAKLSTVIATLRRLSPYEFEELMLTCCKDQGWQIRRNSRYSGDGGIDGRTLIGGKLYAIQAKRYFGYINPEHIREFYQVIETEGAAGGFFIHSGKTGTLSKQLLSEFQIILLSGQKLVDFVLGKKLKIVGITIANTTY